jgi:type IV pilus assembly protein PilX
LFVVIVILTVMLLGAVLMLRVSSTDVLLAGNIAREEAAAQASDVGIGAAFEELKVLPPSVEDTGNGGWYFETRLPDDDEGLPQGVDWENAARSLSVGQYTVKYVIDRQCSSAPVSDETNQCLLRENKLDIRDASGETLVPPALRTYRTTVRVTGPKNTVTWVQALLTWRP